ncbi:hypothetical protein AVEN_140408-1 [Araneus ventricosus]|uniref:Uncharacterized protein n=1 Tax=Araneus ventricosus TaxID=182803 RepID=A0A4Y2VUB6_ARAVE|nr:hypothetical protein AVEN_140408-1 [Araneus ventricosus]
MSSSIGNWSVFCETDHIHHILLNVTGTYPAFPIHDMSPEGTSLTDKMMMNMNVQLMMMQLYKYLVTESMPHRLSSLKLPLSNCTVAAKVDI